jgi:flagellin-like hook-associated protein FlgL
MNDGQSFEAKILWDENPNDPGPYIISGLEIIGDIDVSTQHSMGANLGDNFSFATGNKTFLDHRDSEGKVLSVTYTGSNDNAEFFVGNESKISSFLDAKEGNTAELASVVESLVELRNGLKVSNLTEMAQIVQSLETELISNEDSVVDKMGELSSTLVRMNTVRAFDEEYHLEIDQRLAKDLDVDLSEAIMQLTRVSTAYQAAMQVGAQLLNTSLLNYL